MIYFSIFGGNGSIPEYSGLVPTYGMWCALASRHFVKKWTVSKKTRITENEAALTRHHNM